jgi:outer membrane protein assembly factor BamB
LWAPVQLKGVSRTGVTIDGNSAFVGDNRGRIYSVDLATGHLNWMAKTEGFVETPLAASDGKVYVSVEGTVTTGRTAVHAAVAALNESDGSVAWRHEIKSATLIGSPAIEDGAVFVATVGTASVVTALDASTGSQRWSKSLSAVIPWYRAPAVSSDGVVVVGLSGQTFLLNLSDGSRVWDFALNEQVKRSSPVISGGQVLVPTATGQLAAIDLKSGELVWRSTPTGDPLRDPLLTDQEVVLVRGGGHPGLVAYTHDPAGALVRVDSPTKPKPLLIFGGFALAAVPLAALLLLSGRWLLGRAGATFTEAGDEEPRDPWEDEGPDDEDDEPDADESDEDDDPDAPVDPDDRGQGGGR